ncbi:ribosome-recycling factor, mitochondrial-like [Teleopsis dalmanni]|uniref:ribosome-recycling factor, mitochondrial-like n=1 Tax=Teleopsis dalmanni TaxID=139649 RepID=UPI0018CFE577|nr:ribosome-recycling factor, mitochondrial-like [Teleopsis dalmanni]XP_037933056.1 ribosome-recycling factor, mitochondrial-like [Teleopsis dalmanni]
MYTKTLSPIIRSVFMRQLRCTQLNYCRGVPHPQSLVSPAALTLPTTHQVRNYAKSKDKKKEKGKKPVKVEINEAQLRDIINFDAINGQMQKTVEHMKDDFLKHLSLRSTSGAIDTLRVNVDGTEHELQELAQISRKNPKTIMVNMIGFPQTIPAVLEAITKSGMNLNPQQDGTTLFIPIPKVTKEHRENLSKNAKTLFIKHRDAIKDVQNNTIKKVKKQTDISKDDVFAIQTQVTALADKYVAEAEKLLAVKQKELLGES